MGHYKLHVILGIVFLLGWGKLRFDNHRLRVELDRAKHDGLVAQLDLANANARADSTRKVALVLGDSLTYFARHAEQLSGDERRRLRELDGKLKAETQAKASLETKVVRLEGMLETMATLSGDTLTATFDLRQEPYTLKARAVLTRPPRPSSLGVDVTLDSIPMTLRLTCKAGAGVRTAEVLVGAPSWAQVGIRSVQQDAAICNAEPAPVAKGPSRTKWAVIGGSAALLLAKAFGN